MKRRRIALCSIIMTMLLMIVPVNVHADNNEATYNIYASVYDFGARVDKIVIELNDIVSSKIINKDTFTITSANESNCNLEVENGIRNISNITISDKENGKAKPEGKFIILDLETELSTNYASILQWNEEAFSNIPMTVKYDIKQNQLLNDKTYSYTQNKFIQNEVDEFSEGTSTSGLHYRDYKPKDDKKKHPLIIWLHGAGEGGDNNVTHINGNRGAVAFISDEAKKAFDNPYVLAPQSPDYWMPELVLGDLTLRGTDNTDNLISLIKEYIKNNENIDENRVYIGGCSMGGYQTWETILAQPDLFAAAFPICAAYQTPKDKLETVKDLPIWLVHAKNDDTIPVKYTRDTYAALKDINANVLYTEYDNVQIKGEDFAPHGSWIYPLNNDPKTDDDIHFFEWMASQSKDKKSDTNKNYVVYIIGGTVVVIAGVLVYLKTKKK